jgi:hypothetical protein
MLALEGRRLYLLQGQLDGVQKVAGTKQTFATRSDVADEEGRAVDRRRGVDASAILQDWLEATTMAEGKFDDERRSVGERGWRRSTLRLTDVGGTCAPTTLPHVPRYRL